MKGENISEFIFPQKCQVRSIFFPILQIRKLTIIDAQSVECLLSVTHTVLNSLVVEYHLTLRMRMR